MSWRASVVSNAYGVVPPGRRLVCWRTCGRACVLCGGSSARARDRENGESACTHSCARSKTVSYRTLPASPLACRALRCARRVAGAHSCVCVCAHTHMVLRTAASIPLRTNVGEFVRAPSPHAFAARPEACVCACAPVGAHTCSYPQDARHQPPWQCWSRQQPPLCCRTRARGRATHGVPPVFCAQGEGGWGVGGSGGFHGAAAAVCVCARGHADAYVWCMCCQHTPLGCNDSAWPQTDTHQQRVAVGQAVSRVSVRC